MTRQLVFVARVWRVGKSLVITIPGKEAKYLGVKEKDLVKVAIEK